jgi:hypothetical protein
VAIAAPLKAVPYARRLGVFVPSFLCVIPFSPSPLLTPTSEEKRVRPIVREVAMNPARVESKGASWRRRHRRLPVVLTLCVCVLPFARPVCINASAQDRPTRGRIQVFVTANTERAVAGGAVRQVDVDESANDVRKRAKGLDWFQLADRPENADLVITITGRRKDPNKGFVLNYILEAGDYKVEDEFTFEGGTELTGGIRTLGSDGRTSHEGRRPQSWDEVARQFTRSLEGFAKANYDRILRQRERRQPK